ncbi:hypothetical protein MJG53_019416 [Ovis ammon polii x Ovis aries]|uniref:Uncharacterized protein n=1 Tax=Ovis ammon polii x Ovis aries TaxID=2918886 RepID=A0ACB9TZX6_9CETA|nr:hypothetical protein MJG53_019416 [Ovis ammon polii x Ovis aries]
MWESSDTNSGYAVRSLLTKCQSSVILVFCPIYPWQLTLITFQRGPLCPPCKPDCGGDCQYDRDKVRLTSTSQCRPAPGEDRRGKPSPSDLQKYVALTSVLLSGAGPSEAARTPLRIEVIFLKGPVTVPVGLSVSRILKVTNPSGSGIRIELGVLTGRDLHEETSCIVPDCKPSTRCCDFIIKRSLWPHGVVLDVTSYVSRGLRSWEEYKEYSEENTAAYHFYRYEYSHALNFRFVNSFFSIKV